MPADSEARAAYQHRLGWRINDHLRRTSMPSITDTIDNAIRDYGVSEDAMRWAPDAAPQPRFRPMPTVVVRFEVDTREFVLGVEQARNAARRAGLAKLWTWIDETHDWQAAKRARMRRMHQLYRAKRGRQ